MSKGSRQRPVNRKVYEENYEKIFGKKLDEPETTWYYCPKHPTEVINYRHPCCRCLQETKNAPVQTPDEEIQCPYCGYPARTLYCSNCPSYIGKAPR